MEISQLQTIVDEWIKTHGVRYFDEKTNMLVLMEEVGELSRLMSRVYGEQSFKKKDQESAAKDMIKEELADVLFVITCLANQMGIDLTDAMNQNMEKKTKRDHQRHHDNPKLQ